MTETLYGWHATAPVNQLRVEPVPSFAFTADTQRWCSFCRGYRWQRFSPSPAAGSYWRCSECGEPSHADPIARPRRA